MMRAAALILYYIIIQRERVRERCALLASHMCYCQYIPEKKGALYFSLLVDC